jgi:putative membrane protein
VNTRKIASILLGVYAVLTAYTVFRSFLGLTIQSFFTPLLTIVAFTFALLHGSQRLGWKRILLLLALTFIVSLLFESVGVATGLIYGKYHYTLKLGIMFLGLVPYLIPLAWFMMIYPSYVIASELIPSNWLAWQWRLGVAALGGVIMTAWDLVMDPMMVYGGYWIWDVKGDYFGVPLHNYLGWWVTVFATFALFIWMAGMKAENQPSINPLFKRQGVFSYFVTGVGSILFVVSTGLGGPELVGLFALLPWVIFVLL